MKTYIALLRGINVGGHKKILMADLRALLESLNLKNVQTYIQSGNVVFTCASREASGDTRAEEKHDFEDIIAKAIEAKYGWNVPILIKKASEMVKIIEKCPFSSEKREKSYFILLKSKPTPELFKATQEFSSSDEEFYIYDNCVYIFYSVGAGKAKLGINFFEKKLEVQATARNYRTMMKLIEMAS
jgi:uncharacterized protein (DUF1697 family)